MRNTLFSTLRLALPLGLFALAAGLTAPPRAATEVRGVAATPTAADTLRLQVRAGQPLLTTLPGRHRGQPASYRLIRGPALSWLVDRAFYWRTLPSESGTMPVLVRRVAPGVEPDTLVVMVTLLPANG